MAFFSSTHLWENVLWLAFPVGDFYSARKGLHPVALSLSLSIFLCLDFAQGIASVDYSAVAGMYTTLGSSSMLPVRIVVFLCE